MNIHGHNEYVKVHIQAVNPAPLDGDINMVSEFSEGKKLWHEWIDSYVDHATFLNSKDPLVEWALKHIPNPRLVLTPGDPTTEMMIAVFMAKIHCFLAPKGLKCTRLELEETPTNTVIHSGDISQHIPSGNQYWWNRNDFSTNDL